ncbi:hypothetical protein V5799_024570 [Amblyomma americanum]|uniref:Uncharacterized protein n=1 Tax=Amblyomma americanum TaxID=6943 RepID=A0AAQ4EBN3_AMBAM
MIAWVLAFGLAGPRKQNEHFTGHVKHLTGLQQPEGEPRYCEGQWGMVPVGCTWPTPATRHRCSCCKKAEISLVSGSCHLRLSASSPQIKQTNIRRRAIQVRPEHLRRNRRALDGWRSMIIGWRSLPQQSGSRCHDGVPGPDHHA